MPCIILRIRLYALSTLMDTMRRALCCILTFNANVISIVSMQHTAATMVMVVAVVRYNYFSLRKLLILMSIVRCKEYFFADTVSGALFLVGPIIFHSHLAAATMVFAPFEVLNFIIIVALDPLGETATWSKYLMFFCPVRSPALRFHSKKKWCEGTRKVGARCFPSFARFLFSHV